MKIAATLLVTAGLLLAAWYAFKPAPGEQGFVAAPPVVDAPAPQIDTQSTPAEQLAAEEQPAPVVPTRVAVAIEIRGGRLHSGPQVVKLVQGQTVALTVRSDRNDELHLHGYDIAMPLVAGEPATMTVEATRSGRFEYEIHSLHAAIGALEVYPSSD